jgi:hypothetical protein
VNSREFCRVNHRFDGLLHVGGCHQKKLPDGAADTFSCARNPIFVHEVPECLFLHNGKGLTGWNDKESCLDLVESIRRHAILACLRFLFLQLRMVFRQRALLAMFHSPLQLVSIFQMLVPRRPVLL